MTSPGTSFRPFTGVRIVVDTPLSFDEVSRRLKAEMGNGNIPEILALAKAARTESEFSNEVTKRYVGRSGFMLFAEIGHGTWLTVFRNPPAIRTLGPRNPSHRSDDNQA